MVFLSDPQDIRAVLTGDASALHPGAGAPSSHRDRRALIYAARGRRARSSGARRSTPAFHQRMVTEQTATLTGIVERSGRLVAEGGRGAASPYTRPHDNVILRIIFSDQAGVTAACSGGSENAER